MNELMLPPALLPKWGPTHYLPGTQGKIQVMQQRALYGLPIFHPRDASTGEYGEEGTHIPGTVFGGRHGARVYNPKKLNKQKLRNPCSCATL